VNDAERSKWGGRKKKKVLGTLRGPKTNAPGNHSQGKKRRCAGNAGKERNGKEKSWREGKHLPFTKVKLNPGFREPKLAKNEAGKKKTHVGKIQ